MLVGLGSGQCMDVWAESREPGAGTVIWPCKPAGQAVNQTWSVLPGGESGSVTIYDGAMCLDAWANGTSEGTRIVVWPCHGGANQQWTRTAADELRGASGLCVGVEGGGTWAGAGLVLVPCTGADDRRWRAAAGG
jgi:alpha-galactosidase